MFAPTIVLVAFTVAVLTSPLLTTLANCASPLVLSVALNILVLLTSAFTCAAPVTFNVALVVLALTTMLATVACPVDCKLIPTTLVLLLILAACNAPVEFSVAVVMLLLDITAFTDAVPPVLNAVLALTMPLTSSVLSGVNVPTPTEPCTASPLLGGLIKLLLPANVPPITVVPPISSVFCGIVTPPMPVPVLVKDMFLAAAPTALR